MKPVVYTLAGAALALCLAAAPAAAQRERPAGASGGGSAVGGGGSHSGGGGGSVSSGGSSGGGSSVSGGGGSSSGGGSVFSGGSPSSGGGTAVRRGAAGGGGERAGAGGRTGYVRSPEYGTDQDRAVPRGARPNPGAPVSGQAVVRPRGGPGNGNGGYPYDWYQWYDNNPWYYSSWSWAFSPWGYWDPFWWGYYGAGGYYPYGGYYGGGYGYEGGSYASGYGSLKLKVEPKDAEVYVDGYYMGIVDDFNGVFQGMKLEAGAHKIEIRAPGFQTIAFDVRIELNDTVTYRGELQEIKK